MSDVVIVGAGIFGLTAAHELYRRGHQVTVCAAGPIPHPDAASTDISKVIRADYGPDEAYMSLAQRAIEGWHRWNAEWGEQVYFETGVAFLRSTPAQPGDFEYESRQRLDAQPLPEMPAWHTRYQHGYFNPQAGWARSGRTLELLAQHAEGITILPEQPVASLTIEAGRITGVLTRSGRSLPAEAVIVAAGAWTPTLIPALRHMMQASGHPVFHLKPADPTPFTPPHFTTFTADISTTGWYGFPYNPFAGVVKVANHGEGLPLDPVSDPRIITDDDIAHLRAFLRRSLPALADAELVYTRRCLYCDTPDGDFLIDHHPDVTGLVVASGGSGHGFKFGPVLGGIIADVVEDRAFPLRQKFAWRTPRDHKEASRAH